MGNSSCRIMVVCDQQGVSAGDYLTGKIYMEVMKPGFKCEFLYAQISAQEKTCVHYTTSSGSGKNRKTHHHYIRQRRIVMNTEILLEQFDPGSTVPVGRYEYPVKMQIPMNAPSTIPRVTYNGNWAELTYSIRGFCKQKGKLWDSTVDSSKEFLCQAAQEEGAKSYQLIMPPHSQTVNFCCCFSQGSMTLGGFVGDSIMKRGSSIDIRFALKNNSTAEITTVEAGVHQTISWSARSYHRSYPSVVGQISIDPKEIENTQNHANKQDMRKNQDGFSDEKMVYDELYNQKGGSQVSINLERNGASTYYGSLLSVSHEAGVRIMTGCCIDNPACGVQVRVVGPSSKETYGTNGRPTELPPDWTGSAKVAKVKEVAQKDVNIGGVAEDTGTTVDAVDAPPAYVARVSPVDDKKAILSWESLVAEMAASVDDLVIVKKYLDVRVQRATFLNDVTPGRVTELLKHVDDVFQQPEVALQLATKGFTDQRLDTDMIIAIMTGCTMSSIKPDLLDNCLQICTDKSPANMERIKASLNDFERMICEQLFVQSTV